MKKNTPSGGFDDVSDEGLGQTDGLLMSKEDKRVFLWAQSIDNTAIVFRKKNEIFSPGNLSIQRYVLFLNAFVTSERVMLNVDIITDVLWIMFVVILCAGCLQTTRGR